MPVTAGDAYTLCAGCAYCCYADAGSGQYDMGGCKSYVQGNGLSSFCAEGGVSGRALYTNEDKMPVWYVSSRQMWWSIR